MPLGYVVTLQCYDSTRWTFVCQFPSRFLRLPTDLGLFFFSSFFLSAPRLPGNTSISCGCVAAPLPPSALPDPIALPLVSTGLLTSGSWTSAALVIKEHWSDIHPRLSSSRRLSALTLFLPPPPSFPNHLLLLLVHALYFSVHSPGEALAGIAALAQKSLQTACVSTDCRNLLGAFQRGPLLIEMHL